MFTCSEAKKYQSLDDIHKRFRIIFLALSKTIFCNYGLF